MVCIYCGGKTSVTNSRSQQRTHATWRRRRCTICQSIFTTIENIDLAKTLVITRPNNLEPFSRDALFLSLYDSLKHRKSALEDATSLTATIIGKLVTHVKGAQLDRATILDVTKSTLQRFDTVAATHYGAFHPLNNS